MKILSANLCFKLPDDFNGNFIDALDEFIQYKLKNSDPNIPEEDSDTFTGLSDIELTEQRNTYRTIMESHNAGTSKKAAYSYALCELDESDSTWKPIDDTEEVKEDESGTT